MNFIPRDYQLIAHNRIIECFKQNLKTLLVMATGCLSGDTIVQINRGGNSRKYTLKEACIKFGNYPFDCKGYRFRYAASNKTRSYLKEENNINLKSFIDVVYSGIKDTYTLELEDGKTLRLTACHKVQTKRGMIALKKLSINDFVMVDNFVLPKKSKNKQAKLHDSHLVMGKFHPYRSKIFSTRKNKYIYRVEKHRAIYEAHINGLSLEDFQERTYKKNNLKFINPSKYDIHHKDFDHYNNDPNNLIHLTKYEHQKLHSEKGKKKFRQGEISFSKVKSIKYYGKEEVFDVRDVKESHNFAANNIIVHNSGKSKTVISLIAKLIVCDRYIFILIVQNRKLVNQLAEDAKGFNLDYGVFMADHDEFDESKETQVCSIDTIQTRGTHPHILTEKDIVLIIDEADQAKSAKFQSTINRYLNRKKFNPKAGRTFLLGMTATPYNTLDFFDTFIVPITPQELLKRGFLVDFTYFIPKNAISYEGVTVKRGEWSATQVARKLDTPSMIKASFDDWLEFGDNRQTLIFCMDKQHSINYMNYINEYYGKEVAGFIYDKLSDKERENIINKFKNGVLRFLINIRIITRGVDIPIIGCIVDDAATLNINLHIQKIGRGSRINPFYKDCIVIDHAKNVLNNNHFYAEREISLTKDYKRKKSDIDGQAMRVCKFCFRAADPVWFGPKNVCPFCGKRNAAEKIVKKVKSTSKSKKEDLTHATPEKIEQIKLINEFKKILWKYQNLGGRYQLNMGKLSPNEKKEFQRFKAQEDMCKKYGLDKLIKIKKSISMSEETIALFNRKYNYKPLGGL